MASSLLYGGYYQQPCAPAPIPPTPVPALAPSVDVLDQPIPTDELLSTPMGEEILNTAGVLSLDDPFSPQPIKPPSHSDIVMASLGSCSFHPSQPVKKLTAAAAGTPLPPSDPPNTPLATTDGVSVATTPHSNVSTPQMQFYPPQLQA